MITCVGGCQNPLTLAKAYEELEVAQSKETCQRYWRLIEDLYHLRCAVRNCIAFYQAQLKQLADFSIDANPVQRRYENAIKYQIRRKSASLVAIVGMYETLYNDFFQNQQPYPLCHIDEVESCILNCLIVK